MKKIVVGVISDTHDLLRPEALEALAGSDLIIHAGDVCRPEIIFELDKIAPVRVVRGNNDKGEWAENIPISLTIKIGKISVYVIHNLKELKIDPEMEKIKIVVSGHSHKPSVEKRGETIYLNPGSAGRRRFKLPVTLARIEIIGEKVSAETIQLLE